MSKTIVRALLGASALYTVAATPAFAQSSSTALEEVVVTARRTEERLQDVPISITVYNQEKLDNLNITSGADLAAFTPSMTVNTQFGVNNASFAIRGFRQERRTSASVGVYFADVVAPRGGNGGSPAGDGAGAGSFFDLQNVQVLKGPQGTLFGRNTTGGAVLLVPNKPTDQVEGYLEGSAGDYDMRRLQGVANLPLSDRVRLRVGFDAMKRTGYLKNMSPRGPRDFGNTNYKAFRASLSVDVTSNIENTTILSYLDSEDHGPTNKLLLANNTFPFGLLSAQQIARERGANIFTIENTLENPKNSLRQFQVINTLTWDVNSNLRVRNITSFSTLKNAIQAELFGTYFIIPQQFGPIPNTGAAAGSVLGYAQSYHIPNGNTADQKNVTSELQLQGKTDDGRLTWQAGAYFEQSLPTAPSGSLSPVFIPCVNSSTFQCTDVLGQLLRTQLGRLAGTAAEVYFQNLGVYGQATYALTDQLKLTAGLRYTKDSTKATSQQITYVFNAPGGVPAAAPIGTCGLPGGDVNCRYYAKQRSDAPTWLISLDYKPTEDVMVYGKYARGYRQGAVSYNAPPPYQTYEPEKVDSYEVGAKASFRWPVPGSVNIAAFYNDFTNQQLAVGIASSLGLATPNLAVINAGKSRIQGVELEAMVMPFKGFTIDAQYAYLHTRVKSIENIIIVAGSPYDIFRPFVFAGSRLPETPTHKWVVNASYQLPVPEAIGDVTLSATYSFTDDYVATPGVYGIIGSNELINASVNWNSMFGKPVDFSVFVTNLTNQNYIVGISDNTSNVGHVAVQVAEPRMFGMRLRYRWGG